MLSIFLNFKWIETAVFLQQFGEGSVLQGCPELFPGFLPNHMGSAGIATIARLRL
jgi:hypothetical protein